MLCEQCGKKIEDEELPYCPNCGAKIHGNRHEDAIERKKQEETNEIALSSMLTGVMSLFIPFLDLPLSIVAIVLAKKRPNHQYSKIGAITGTIGLIVSILIYVGFIVWLVLYILAILSKLPVNYPTSSF